MNFTRTNRLWRPALIGAATAIAILGAACTDDDIPEDATSTEVTATTGATETSSTPPTIETTEMGEGESVHVTYECAYGLTFEAEVSQVPSTWAIIEVDGETIEMQQTISGSGIRYQGDDYQYQSKGEEATLLKDDEVIRADCVQAS